MNTVGTVANNVWFLWSLGTIHDWHSHTPWLVFFDALSLYTWWIYRDWPDENRWKRRGKKLKDAIAIRAGRLVVVPAR
jgi:hypothetical protein